MAVTEQGVLRFLEDELAIDLTSVGTDTLLFSSGLVDSFSLVDLMSFIETEGGFRILPGDVTLENFDSVERIVAFADRR